MSGLPLTSVSVGLGPGIALHRLNSGDLCLHCPCTATTQPTLGELRTLSCRGPNGLAFAFCSGRAILSHLEVTVPLQVAMGCHRNIKVPLWGANTPIARFLLSMPVISIQHGPPTVPCGIATCPCIFTREPQLVNGTLISGAKVDF